MLEIQFSSKLSYCLQTSETGQAQKVVAGAGKVKIQKNHQISINEFMDRHPASTIVFVAVDDELAMCIALGGLRFKDISLYVDFR